jgi:hypothetical protein
MIIITVDLVPAGFQPMRRTIGTLRIANISDLAEVSDYAVDFLEAATPLAGTKPRNANCTVERHNRHQSVWALLAKASEAASKADFDEL